MRLANQAGLGIDTASIGELTCALRAGAPAANIGLHGNNKSEAEIRLAIRAGIGRIIADSLYEVQLISRVAAELGARDVPVMVRVNSGVHAGGHEFIATAHEDQKFGLAPAGDALVAARQIHDEARLRFAGLHSHIGSQIFAYEGFAQAARRMIQVAAALRDHGIATDHVILGGGYGIAYSARDDVAPSPKDFANRLAEAVRTETARQGVDVPRIGVEPGRSIAGPSMVTLYRVGTIKHQPLGDGTTRAYVSVDGGMSDNIRPALYGAHYTALLASRRSTAQGMLARVVGKHCESGDIVVHDVILPADLRAGDVLAVPATGAYGHSMASNYNMVARPGVVGVEGGATRQIIAAETVDDVLARDVSLPGDAQGPAAPQSPHAPAKAQQPQGRG